MDYAAVSDVQHVYTTQEYERQVLGRIQVEESDVGFTRIGKRYTVSDEQKKELDCVKTELYKITTKPTNRNYKSPNKKCGDQPKKNKKSGEKHTMECDLYLKLSLIHI